jgi:hypothetical protein
MNGFRMTLLAVAAAAVAAIAVVALPAIGDSGTTGTDNGASGLTACLARHGLPGAPTGGRQRKQWLAGKVDQDPGAVRAAIDACQPSDHGSGAPGPDAARIAARMSACLRSHGFDAPTAPADFKRWIEEQQQAGRAKALDDALGACKMALAP